MEIKGAKKLIFIDEHTSVFESLERSSRPDKVHITLSYIFYKFWNSGTLKRVHHILWSFSFENQFSLSRLED